MWAGFVGVVCRLNVTRTGFRFFSLGSWRSRPGASSRAFLNFFSVVGGLVVPTRR